MVETTITIYTGTDSKLFTSKMPNVTSDCNCTQQLADSTVWYRKAINMTYKSYS